MDPLFYMMNSPWVFPSVKDPSRPPGHDLSLWLKVRREAGIEDCRLHDLRHRVASQAALNGVPLTVVPLTVVARLLGHSTVRMTLRDAHVGDKEVGAVAERVGTVILMILKCRP